MKLWYRVLLVVAMFGVFSRVVWGGEDCTVIDGGPYSCMKCPVGKVYSGGEYICPEPEVPGTCYNYGSRVCGAGAGYGVHNCTEEGTYACSTGCCAVGSPAPVTNTCKSYCVHSTSLTPPETICNTGLANQYFETYKDGDGNTFTNNLGVKDYKCGPASFWNPAVSNTPRTVSCDGGFLHWSCDSYPGPSRILAEGYFYAATAGDYSFMLRSTYTQKGENTFFRIDRVDGSGNPGTDGSFGECKFGDFVAWLDPGCQDNCRNISWRSAGVIGANGACGWAGSCYDYDKYGAMSAAAWEGGSYSAYWLKDTILNGSSNFSSHLGDPSAGYDFFFKNDRLNLLQWSDNINAGYNLKTPYATLKKSPLPEECMYVDPGDHNITWMTRYLTQGYHKVVFDGSPARFFYKPPGGSWVEPITLGTASNQCPFFAKIPTDPTCCDCSTKAAPTVSLSGPASGILSWSANWGGECDTGTRTFDFCVGSAPGNCIYRNETGATESVVSRDVSSLPAGVYSWSVIAHNKCGKTASAASSFTINSPPTWIEPPPPIIEPQNPTNNTPVSPEVGVTAEATSNQICDTNFSQRTVKFVVTTHDVNGGGDIDEVYVDSGSGSGALHFQAKGLSSGSPSWNVTGPASFVRADTSVSGTNRIVTMTVNFPDNFPRGNYALNVAVMDKQGAWATGDAGLGNYKFSGRYLRIWDCKVGVSGSIYDASAQGTVYCPSVGYSNLADYRANFKQTTFTGVGGGAVTQTINAASINSYSGGSSQKLLWGGTYQATLNTDLAAPSSSARWQGTGQLCGTQQTVNNSLVNPYVNDPSLTVDFSLIPNQDPWYQVNDGGIRSGGKISDQIPPTCNVDPLCSAAVTTNSGSRGTNANGLLWANSGLTNDCIANGCSQYGKPNNWLLSAKAITEKYSYQKLYNDYFVNMGYGETHVGDFNLSTLGTNLKGIQFITGTLTIDTNNSLGTGDFLMLVAKSGIIINPAASNIKGVLVTDGQIVIGGESAQQLVIEGVLYSTGNAAKISRTFENKTNNNTNPAVVVKYNPELIFTMPQQLLKTSSKK